MSTSERYSRQIMLPEVGEEGQQKLLEAHVGIIGLGGLGAPVAMYLAAAGVGKLTLVDFDVVDLSNLQRQIIHFNADIGKLKVTSAAEKIQQINPEIEVVCRGEALEREEMTALVKDADVMLDCTDNFASRFELNAITVAARKPLVSAGVIRLEGQVCVFDHRHGETPCYQCLYQPIAEGEGETCSRIGVLSSAPGVIGSLQATETLKLLLGLPTLNGELMLLDLKTMEWQKIRIPKNPNCTVCSG